MIRPNSRLLSLWVEGPDDGAVVNALVLKKLRWDISQPSSRVVKVPRQAGEERGGFEQTLAAFCENVDVLQPDARVGLLVDRDNIDSKPDRWIEVRTALVARGFSPPEQPEAGGWVAPGKTPGSKIGVWLMPDNVSPGDLEHFIERLMPPDRDLWSYAQQATNDARNHSAGYLPKDHRKACIHAWLSWLDGPGGGYGIAIRRGDLLNSVPAVDVFLAWFKRLLLEP